MPTDHVDEASTVFATVAGALPRLRQDLLRLFLEELFRWNPQLGLVSKRDPPAVVSRLILQSIRLWDFVLESIGEYPVGAIRRVADIGSGAGFPSLVWKMLVPELDVLLIERKERKAVFLERVTARAKLSGVTVVAADLRQVSQSDRFKHAFDLGVMMAVAEPAAVACDVESLLRESGFFLTVRSRNQKDPGVRLGRRLEELARCEAPEGRFHVYRCAGAG